MHTSKLVLLLFSCFLLVNSTSILAQKNHLINGTIQDSASGKSLSNVSIAVFHKDTGKIISGLSSSEQGTFSLNLNDTTGLFIAFSHIGYKKKVFPISLLTQLPVLLAPSEQELQGVVIKANKTITSFEDDRIKYDIQAMQDIKYLTIDQLMQRLPFLLYDEKSLKFMNADVTILIDNKKHPLYSSPEGLKQLPLHAIEKIELMIAPSARTEGTRVLNITLKSNYFLGWNGRINANVSKINYGTEGRVSYWSKKIGGDISFNQAYSKIPFESSTTIHYYQTGETARLNQDRLSRSSTYQTYASLYLNINDKNTIDVSTSLDWQPSNIQSVTFSQRQILGNPLERLSESQPQETENNSYGFGLNYTRKFKKKGREFYFLNKYYNQNKDIAYRLERLRGFDQTIQDYLEIYKKLAISKELTSELVYTDNLGKSINYSVGSKLIYRNNDSDQNRNTVTPDSAFSDNLIFVTNQLVSSTFLDLQFKIKGISLNGGTRLDYSRFSFERFSSFNRDYYNLPLNLSASRKLGKKHLLQLAYSRTIYRPSLENFVPFAVAENSYFSKEGNLNLAPEIGNSVSTGLYSDYKFGSIGFNVSYRRHNDLIRDFYDSSNNGQLVAKSANLDLYQSVGLDISAQIRFSPKLQFTHSSNGNFVVQESGKYKNKRWLGYINDQLIYRLTKKQTLVLSAIAYSPHLEIQGRSQSMDYINTSLSYYLNLDLSKTIPANLGVRISNPWKPNGLPSYNYRDTETFRYYQSSLKANYLIGISFSMNFMGKHYGQRFNRNRGIYNDDLQSGQ